MTGPEFRAWADKNIDRFSHKFLADALGVSDTTLYNLFRSAQLDKRTVLALAQLGCKPPKPPENRRAGGDR